MIFTDEVLDDLVAMLKIDSIDSYPYLETRLMPAAEVVIAEAVGAVWVAKNEQDPAVIQVACALVAAWFEKPELFGELTPGANFIISQIQARALEATT